MKLTYKILIALLVAVALVGLIRISGEFVLAGSTLLALIPVTVVLIVVMLYVRISEK
jgi:hypothetical protein